MRGGEERRARDEAMAETQGDESMVNDGGEAQRLRNLVMRDLMLSNIIQVEFELNVMIQLLFSVCLKISTARLSCS